MQRVLLTILASTVFSGCASTTVCPPVIEYPDEFQEQLVVELQNLPEDYTAIPWAIQDYRLTREQLRTCQ